MLNGLSNWFHDDGDLAFEDVVVGYVDLIVGRMLGGRSCAPDGPPHAGRGGGPMS